MKQPQKKSQHQQDTPRRCANAVCDAYPCFGKKYGDRFTWACGDHRAMIELPPLPVNEYVAPQGRLL